MPCHVTKSFPWRLQQEMIGLCAVLGSSDPAAAAAVGGPDPVKYFGRAFEHYSKVPGRSARMLATRAMTWAAGYHIATGRHLAANQCLMRAHYDEENARAALLLEEASYCLLRAAPPARRKYAFGLVLAGLRYQSARVRRLAAHCYLQVGDGLQFEWLRTGY